MSDAIICFTDVSTLSQSQLAYTVK